VLSRYAVALDFKNRRVWFEDPRAPRAAAAESSAEDDNPEPIHYRGVRP
jgi:hypothetical protein